MKKLIFTLILILILILNISSITVCQTAKDSIYNPCKDKLYNELQKKNLDSLSQREYDYYIEKVKQCNEYMKLVKQLQTKKEIETEPGNGVAILAIIFAGLAVLTVIGILLNNNNK